MHKFLLMTVPSTHEFTSLALWYYNKLEETIKLYYIEVIITLRCKNVTVLYKYLDG
jgi:hypothetical protein